MSRVLLFSGGGDFADPWHPFGASNRRVAELLGGEERSVTVTDLVDECVASLDSGGVQLLVVNAGNAEIANPLEPRLLAAIRRHVAGGGALLALHVSVTLFADSDEWEALLGGRWVRGVTMHPPYGRDPISVATNAHPIVHAVADFEIDDERYTDMRVAPEVTPLVWHEHAGIRRPLVWVRNAEGGRIVVDLLGHDSASYDSPEHRSILRQAVAWLISTGARPDPGRTPVTAPESTT